MTREDLFAYPSETLEPVLEFLSLPKRGFEIGGLRTTEGYTKPMASDTRYWLQEYYEPHTHRLYKHFGRDFGR